MGHGGLGYTFTIGARSIGNTPTQNYSSPGYSIGSPGIGTVTLEVENNDSGAPLTSRLTPPGGSWSSGIYTFTTTTATFSRAPSPDGPFDVLRIGVAVNNDPDSRVLDARDMNASTAGACGGACTAQSIGSATKVRFGRLRMQNALASSGALALLVPIELQYWDGSASPNIFKTNTVDTCTTIAPASVTLNPNLTPAGSTSVQPPLVPITFNNGLGSIRLAPPGGANRGYVTVTPTLPSYLQGAWTGASWDQNPTARASWGIFGAQPQNFIYQRENY
jgi:hypothetical protein